ncbi:hypothetical protein V6N12_037170 [Hibiscus sabdariffa]|uniref:Uncharacterized protein n=1 Tax=Hibiscus sabdariffa TaxID=183260 RepID=A0ABR2ARR3_9ROSI
MFIGDGTKLVCDAFQLAIGTKCFDREVSGDRDVQRTMLELLNPFDSFSSDERIKARGCILVAFSLEKELLVDEKQYAEHIMLVNLRGNDVGNASNLGFAKIGVPTSKFKPKL